MNICLHSLTSIKTVFHYFTKDFSLLFRFVLDNILAYIKECGQTYNSRDFGDKNAIYNELKNTALRKKAELEGKGQKVHIFYEEPFVLDIDDINFQVILVAENDELYRFRL